MRAVRARGVVGARRIRRGPVAGVVAGLLALTLAAAGCSADGEEPAEDPSASPSSPSSSAPPEPLSFGVLGPPAERRAWEGDVESWNATDPKRKVRMVQDFDHERLLEQITEGQVPDVFVARREDLQVLVGAELVQPVDELLDERGVDFGDGFSRDALQLFSVDEGLQCMPLSASPLVMYVNTALVDLDLMAARGLEVPRSETQWTFDQMAAVARFASRPELGTRGLYVDPTVRGLAPYVLSAGGSVFDDMEDPTGLDLSSDESESGIERLLQLLRSPQTSPTPEELEEYTPRQLFQRGELAMLAGYRSLTPALRRESSLAFDVREMPSLGTDATLGDVTGLCLARGNEDIAAAADFLVYLLRPANIATLARVGYIVPTSLEVAQSGAFLQRIRQPAHAEVFLDSLRDIRPLPPLDYAALDEAVGPLVRRLFQAPVIDLPRLLERIDERSRVLLDPEYEPEAEEPGEASPGEEPSEG